MCLVTRGSKKSQKHLYCLLCKLMLCTFGNPPKAYFHYWENIRCKNTDETRGTWQRLHTPAFPGRVHCQIIKFSTPSTPDSGLATNPCTHPTVSTFPWP
jgi:hypothetical protein